LFFSATMPPEIQKLTDRFLRDPQQIRVSPPSSTVKTITQRLKFAPADSKAKRQLLRDLIRAQNGTVKNAIIFCNRKKDVGILHKSLLKHGFNAGALHGDMDQKSRMATLDAFRKGEITFLAASDVAARGLDIPEVSHIFNFDVPISPEDYVHRIGRTGRAGREGYAAMLVMPKDMKALRAIENLCREKIEWIDGEPSTENLTSADFSEKRSRRSGGRRGVKPQGSAAAGGADVNGHGAQPQRPNGDAPSRHEASETRPSAEVRQFRKPDREERKGESRETRRPDNRKSSSRGRELPAASGMPVVGLGDHVPAFLKRPVRVVNG
jgi:superfamily II DNA/RNA helicase